MEGLEGFLKRHGFKVILFTLVVVMMIWLIMELTGMRQANSVKDFPRNDVAPSFQLTHVDGQEVSLADTDGQVRLVYFYFSTCPDVCPPTTYFLSQVQEKLKAEGKFGTEASIYSITFDPKRDTPERLLEFSGNYNADLSSWYFLRGEEQYSRDLAKDYGVMVVEEENGSFGHSNLIFLIDQDGNIRKYYGMSENLTAEDIVEDIDKLL